MTRPYPLLFLTLLVACMEFGLSKALSDPASDQATVSSPSLSNASASPGWPRNFSTNGNAFTIYQPQAVSWTNGILTFRQAVSVLPQGAAQPIFGTVKLCALTQVDEEQQTVSLTSLAVSKSKFPSAPDQAILYASQLIGMATQWGQQVSLGAITASLAVTSAQNTKAHGIPVQNTPPKIYFSQSPALLVLVDGPPALRNIPGSTLLRVVNTSALLAMDQSSGLYFLRVNGGWMQAPALTGPWTDVASTSTSLPALSNLLQQAQSDGNVQLYDPPATSSTPPAMPSIFVSTTPAELIITQGQPAFEPISGTQLLHASNTSSSLFMDIATQSYFVLISGRWFTANSLSGPWSYTASNQLPSDFSNIPENATAGGVLASVAGTPQAQEAAISATIPQTARISRSTTTNVAYAGVPQFKQIEGTPLSYAPNTSTPVIKVSDNRYYAVMNGVWFSASSPTGPWSVTDHVPPVIYSIPPSCPIYYATGVYVYQSTPDYVTVGYTPSYFGTCITPEGIVVYGTGYNYTPYINEGIWIAPPLTYGYGAGFACGLATGFAFGLAVDHGWGCSPTWGPWHGGWGSVNSLNWNNVTVNHQNIYNQWGNNLVKNGPYTQSQINNAKNTAQNDYNTAKSKYQANHPMGNQASSIPNRNELKNDASHLGNNNLFAGKDGQPYRSNENGDWQQLDHSGWKDAEQSKMQSSTFDDLNDQRAARNIGSYRSDGGGFSRGGGGFRR